MILYVNECSKNIVNKKLDKGFNLPLVLRGDIDLINPVIKVGYSGVKDYNYCYIPKLKRWYFIDSIKTITPKLYELKLSIDVLMTYKEMLQGVKGSFKKEIGSGDYGSVDFVPNGYDIDKIIGVDVFNGNSVVLSTVG